ncbi:restriction endonuclease [Bacillus mycoides]|uniref:restriction endonuclease n=1 Tax=Bacillus mycoides TaxID=1405 RepID=UPI000A27E297|nr:restriction endonuclease [Bacillus mycoides]OSX88001.1 hypothetical protein BTJ44_03678 [Bacillus mycoides]
MGIPNYAEIRWEFLKLASSHKLFGVGDAVSKLAQVFNLDDEQLELRTPSRAKKFYSRVNFTRKTTEEKGFITLENGYIQLTTVGEKVLNECSGPITNKVLRMYSTEDVKIVPRQVNDNINKLSDRSEKLLNRLKEIDFNLFEDLMLDFLFEMGYGISKASLKKNIKKTRDWGLDGHVELDVLGVDKIYIQAKRWRKTSVGIDYIQRFSGSIDTKGGNKGIFVTTSTFTSDARTCSELINNKFIRLIDGQELVKFMEDLNFTFD